MINVTNTTASTMVMNTLLMERSMNTVESNPISTLVPSGNDSLMRGSTALIALATSNGLATACLMMPIEIAVSPS